MTCASCGNQLRDDAVRCAACGTRVGAEPAPPVGRLIAYRPGPEPAAPAARPAPAPAAPAAPVGDAPRWGPPGHDRYIAGYATCVVCGHHHPPRVGGRCPRCGQDARRGGPGGDKSELMVHAVRAGLTAAVIVVPLAIVMSVVSAVNRSGRGPAPVVQRERPAPRLPAARVTPSYPPSYPPGYAPGYAPPPAYPEYDDAYDDGPYYGGGYDPGCDTGAG